MKVSALSVLFLAIGAIAQGTSTKTTKTSTKKSSTKTSSTKTTAVVSTTLVTTTKAATTTVAVATTTKTASGPVGTGIYSEACPFGYGSLNGGTTGGRGGPVTVVTTYEALNTTLQGDDPKIVIIEGTITGDAVAYVGSNKSIFGRNGSLVGIGLRVLNSHNVIIRNLKIGKATAPKDAIGVQGPTTKNVWIDHVDLYADVDHDKDYYDGLLDITHAVDYVTVSNVFFHDHWKGSLVGHSDSNCPEDSGHLLVTFALNHWDNIHSRGPMVRCGQVHIYNNYYNNLGDGIRTRAGAQVLVENNVWELTNDPLIAKNGYAVARGNDFGVGQNEAPEGTFTTAPYPYNLLLASEVKAYTIANAGVKLTV